MAWEGDWDPVKRLCTCLPVCGADEFRGHCFISSPIRRGFFHSQKCLAVRIPGRKCRWLDLFGVEILDGGESKEGKT